MQQQENVVQKTGSYLVLVGFVPDNKHHLALHFTHAVMFDRHFTHKISDSVFD
jgi:hypothetical protein